MTRWLTYLATGLLLGACVSKSIAPGTDRSSLFPPGTYNHQIAITTSGNKQFDFKGIVKLSKEKIVVVGLSAFHTTVFRIVEDRISGKVESEVFLEPLEKHKASLFEFYSILSRFLKLPRDGKIPEVTVEHYDAEGVPDEMSIAHPRYRVHVKVVGYEI